MKPRVIVCIVASLIVIACSELEDPTGVRIEDVVQLKADAASVRADGASTVNVQATIPREATIRSVKFNTTHGTFQNTGNKTEITVIADEQGVANATIIGGREAGMSNVTATVGSLVVSLQLLHERAHAQTLTAETNSSFATMNGATKPAITAILTRQTGSVSNGTRVTFDASQGRIFNVGTTDMNGRASATFAADTITAANCPTSPCTATITITTPTDTGSNLSTQLVIEVRSP